MKKTTLWKKLTSALLTAAMICTSVTVPVYADDTPPPVEDTEVPAPVASHIGLLYANAAAAPETPDEPEQEPEAEPETQDTEAPAITEADGSTCSHENGTYEQIDNDCLYHFWVCSDCGKKIYKEHVNSGGYVGGTEGYCWCGLKENNASNIGYTFHNYTASKYDAANHKYTCTRCGDTYLEGHTPLGGDEDPNSLLCKICGNKYDVYYPGEWPVAEHHGYITNKTIQIGDCEYHREICEQCGVSILSHHILAYGNDTGMYCKCGAKLTSYSGRDTHVWERKMIDENFCQDVCSVCGNTRDRSIHVLYNDGAHTPDRCRMECGYVYEECQHEYKAFELDEDTHVYKCKKCGEFKFDENGQKIVEKHDFWHDHKGNLTWALEGTLGYTQCETCGAKKYCYHNDGVFYMASPTTETHSAHCNVCEMKVEDKIPHTYVYTDKDENVHTKACQYCDLRPVEENHDPEFVTSEYYHEGTCACGRVVVPQENHKWDEWRPAGDGRCMRSCEVCGIYEYCDHNRTGKTYKSATADTHYELCKYCGATLNDGKAVPCDKIYTSLGSDDHKWTCKCGNESEREAHKIETFRVTANKYLDNCILCDYVALKENAGSAPSVNEVEWFEDDTFFVQLELLRDYWSIDNIVLQLLGFENDEDGGAQIGESKEITTESGDEIKIIEKEKVWEVEIESKIKWEVEPPEEITIRIGGKKPGGGEVIVTEKIKVRKGKKTTPEKTDPDKCEHFGTGIEYHSKSDTMHYTVCAKCHTLLDDNIPHEWGTEITGSGTAGKVIRKCTKCGATREEDCPHNAPDTNKYVSTNDVDTHSIVCGICEQVIGEEPHGETEAHAKNDKFHFLTCKKCGGYAGDKNHKLGKRIFTSVKSKVSRLGKYYYVTYTQRCTDCGTIFTGEICATSNGLLGWFCRTDLGLMHQILNEQIREEYSTPMKVVNGVSNVLWTGLFCSGIYSLMTAALEATVNTDGKTTFGVMTIDKNAINNSMGEFKCFTKDGKEITKKADRDNAALLMALSDAAPEEGWSEEDYCLDLSDNMNDEIFYVVHPSVLNALEDGEHTMTVMTYVVDENDPSAVPKAIANTSTFWVSTETDPETGETIKVMSDMKPLGAMMCVSDGSPVRMNLSQDTFYYTGSAINAPAAVLTTEMGVELAENSDYTLEYYKIDGETLTVIPKDKMMQVGTYRIVATAKSEDYAGEAYADFRIIDGVAADVGDVTVGSGSVAKLDVRVFDTDYAVSDVQFADSDESAKAAKAGLDLFRMTTIAEGDSGYYIGAAENAPIGTTELKLRIDSETAAGVTATSCATFKVTVKNGDTPTPPEPVPTSEWNLFESIDEHIFAVNVTSKTEVANSNKASAKFFDATLSKDRITVTLKDGADRKKAVNSNILEFDLGEEGSVTYLMPLVYSKPTLKLSTAKATVKSGVETTLTTEVLQLTDGIYTPFDLTGARLKYGSNSVRALDSTVFITVSGKASDKLMISKDGWNANDPVQLAFTVSAVTKDVLTLDLGGLKQVTLNTNAPEQVLSFPLTFNGAPASASTVAIDSSKKGSALGSIGDGVLNVSIGRSGIGKGSYTLNLSAGGAKLAVKVKVSDKALNSAITAKVTQKYDIVTKQPMMIVPTLKEVSGKITGVEMSGLAGFGVMLENGNIRIDYNG
ncbi:MAG: hypothetical protein IJT87_09970, partial [Ruminiclostridium sp.]|nr:hypothetical protein [Ruminiclostridium sp.]